MEIQIEIQSHDLASTIQEDFSKCNLLRKWVQNRSGRLEGVHPQQIGRRSSSGIQLDPNGLVTRRLGVFTPKYGGSHPHDGQRLLRCGLGLIARGGTECFHLTSLEHHYQA